MSKAEVQGRIQEKLASGLQTTHLEVINESHMHNVPRGSESHFRVTIVSPQFSGQRLLQRHRTVNALLREELAGPVHALALHTLSPDEWRQRGGRVTDSPPCHGGSGRGPAAEGR